MKIQILQNDSTVKSIVKSIFVVLFLSSYLLFCGMMVCLFPICT